MIMHLPDLPPQYDSWINLLVGGLAGLFLLRQALIILAADRGRKHDLVKKPYKNTQEFHLSVLIPFLDSNQHPALLTLLQAIADQDYPTAKVSVHLVTNDETRRELIPQSLRPNVKVWQYPQSSPRFEHAVTWLIDRVLAAGGSGMLVFLKATDIVKPDFMQNIVSRGVDSFAIQGYVALKNPPESPMAKMYALSTRLFNRIGNAGRFHLGMSCRLLDSGWAIKQEVLEMIPYHRGMDLDNLEYSIRLNLENFRINWAPNVVVYSDSDLHFLEQMTMCTGALFNRAQLLFRYGPRLLTRMLFRFDVNYLEQFISIIKPPFFMAFMGLVVLGLLDWLTLIPIPGDERLWAGVAGIALLLNVISLVVARCKGDDYLTMLFYTPVVYLFGLVTSPVALFTYARGLVASRSVKGASYRRLEKTRFNEDLDAAPSFFDEKPNRRLIQGLLKKNAPKSDPLAAMDVEPRAYIQSEHAVAPMGPMGEPVVESPVSRARLPKETVRSVPLTNGSKQISCLLKTLMTYDEAGQEHYCLTLEYKSMAFSTETYRILDQAFYELQSKLMGRGFTIMACGSCGNFYNPTADVPGALKNAGVCLFGKNGKEVNLQTDAVTVMSPACSYHCPLGQREGIVRQWKESLTLSRTR
jgi:hypothetical protein